MNHVLKYGSNKHTEILTALRNRIDKGAEAVNKKAGDYATDEDRYMAYMKLSDADKLREEKRTAGDPQFITLAVPYSFAMLMSWHTYITSVFLSRNPVLQFMGRHGETEQQIQAVEAIMDYQTLVGEHLVPYYIWILDAGKYGVGIIGNYWDVDYVQVSEIVEESVTMLGVPILGQKKKIKKTRRTLAYEGNKLFNVRPQDWFYDSRVSMMNFQQGEYCGRYCDIGWNTLIKRGELKQYYNVDALRALRKAKAQTAARCG